MGLAALLPLLAQVDGGARPAVTLTVEADGFKDGAGQALARLYLPGMSVTGPPAATARGPIKEGRAHNANGEIDHAFGFPREPLGFSRGFRLGLFSGLPTFEKLRFTLSGDRATQAVTVR